MIKWRCCGSTKCVCTGSRKRHNMNFRIKVKCIDDYNDSFEHYLSGCWQDESIVEENLDRIVEHYKKVLLTEEGQDLNIEYPWFTNNLTWRNTIKLKLDDGDEYITNVTWITDKIYLNSVSADVDLKRLVRQVEYNGGYPF